MENEKESRKEKRIFLFFGNFLIGMIKIFLPDLDMYASRYLLAKLLNAIGHLANVPLLSQNGIFTLIRETKNKTKITKKGKKIDTLSYLIENDNEFVRGRRLAEEVLLIAFELTFFFAK